MPILPNTSVAFRGSGPLYAKGRGFLFLASLLLFTMPLAARAQLDLVAASVGGDLITERDIQFYLFELRLYDPSLEAIPDSELAREAVPSVVDEYLLYRHFSVDATEPAPESLNKTAENAWRDYVGRAGSEERLNQMIAGAGLRPEDVRGWLTDRARRSMTINRALTESLDPALFEQAGDDPSNAQRFLVAQIVVEPRVPGEEGWLEAKQRALRIYVDIERGLPFEKAAIVFSDDLATASRGGMVGWVEQEVLAPDILEALRELEPGKVSAPVRGPGAYHVLRLVDFETPLREERLDALRATRDQLLARLRTESDVQLAERYEGVMRELEIEPDQATIWEKIAGREREEKEEYEGLFNP